MLDDGAVVGVVLGCVVVTNAISIAITWFLTKRHYLKKQTVTVEEPVYSVPPDARYPVQQPAPTSGNQHMLPVVSPRRSLVKNRPPPADEEASTPDEVFTDHVFYEDTVTDGQQQPPASPVSDVSNRHATPYNGLETNRNQSTPSSPSSPSKISAAPFQKPPRNISRSLDNLAQPNDYEEEELYITYKTEDRHRERAMSDVQVLNRDHIQTISQAIRERAQTTDGAASPQDSDYEPLDYERPSIDVKDVWRSDEQSSPKPGSYVSPQQKQVNPSKPPILPRPKYLMGNRV